MATWYKLFLCALILVFASDMSAQVKVNTPEQQDSTDNEEGIDEDEEFDEIEPDSTFDDYLKSIGYGFDSTLIPAHNLYNHTWDTKKIHVYEQDLSKIKDTTMIVLQDGNDCYFHPPCFGYITSKFGYRRMRRRRRGRMHFGTDVKLYKGDPVYSAFDGIVRIAQYSRSYGYVVVVRHYNGLETIYAHFSKLLTKPGMIIKAGDPIGLGGNTGRSYGSHLHFEVRFKGLPFDATKIIDFETGKLISDTIYIDQNYLSHLKRTKYAGGSRYKGGKGSTKGAKYYKVRRGDTLGGIAVRYGTTITRLCRLNGLRRNSIIRVGQRLRIR
jgi:murein DD-endopeptidase MepM/ murein hydrolase activator NlpD